MQGGGYLIDQICRKNRSHRLVWKGKAGRYGRAWLLDVMQVTPRRTPCPGPPSPAWPSELGVSRQTISNVLNAPRAGQTGNAGTGCGSHRGRRLPAQCRRPPAAHPAVHESGHAAAPRHRRHQRLHPRPFPARGHGGRAVGGLPADALLCRYATRTKSASSSSCCRWRGLTASSSPTAALPTSGPGGCRSRGRRSPFSAGPGTTAALPRPDHPWVDVDGAAGTAAAVAMLVAQGHSRIGFLGGAGSGRWARTGAKAGSGACGGSGLAEHVPDLGATAPDTVSGGITGGRQLVAKGATALVCSSDALGIGALDSLREAHPGLFLPGESELRAAAVGFDNTPVAAALGLSSVDQPVEDAARHLIRLLTHGLAGQPDGAGRPRIICCWLPAWWNGFRCPWSARADAAAFRSHGRRLPDSSAAAGGATWRKPPWSPSVSVRG